METNLLGIYIYSTSFVDFLPLIQYHDDIGHEYHHNQVLKHYAK